ncbi:hypothetical protein SAMN05660909_05610 [Chitinophaga terrae (ex Kim and Jung 2007)]|uniref:GTPase-associated system helical domain-containing protein n=1 Tax=Chitinophaga terrae (ex Kim and Jung 2007) TaxID=408074 RepID=A0A1H4GQ36_9BACT|nr:GTPase-associated system all-helical protein GASH [Chitinophaga terrae (ex Kim and Jung 2007)]GEP93665.1 hypothetical protein CTE07_53100 [Chitinophaga terrae (ex Kim and Jung 2007)]SEB11726.1 hypothetical protein SAMN05660909_05610 [Chitinophaga terrae (ex Kim and Jung 2007)]
MSKYTAKDFFVDWYRAADPNVNSATKTNRMAALDKIIMCNEIEEWFSIIQIILLENPANEDTEWFATFFKEKDETFPLINNLNHLKILAKVAICMLLEAEESYVGDFVAYSILTSRFLHKERLDVNEIVLSNYAEKYLDNSIPLGRKLIEKPIEKMSLDEFDEKSEEAITWAAILPLFQRVNELSDRQNALSEESNVLWWLFGEHLKTNGQHFKEAGPVSVALLGAIELASLTQYEYGFPSSRDILTKAINLSTDSLKEVTFSEVLTSIPALLKDVILKYYKEEYAIILPTLSIIYDGLNANGKDPANLISEKYGVPSEQKYSLYQISDQLYHECLLKVNWLPNE